MDEKIEAGHFDPKKFLATIGEGRKVGAFPKKQIIFSLGKGFRKR